MNARPSCCSCSPELFDRKRGAEARNCLELVESSARVPEPAARKSSGTITPAAAAIGAAIRLVLSPTPPVECLSTLTPGNDGKIDCLARPHHRYR